MAWIAGSWLPWFYWLTVGLLPVLAIVWVENAWLRSRTGQRILWICGTVFLAHAIWALLRSQFYDAAVFGTYWKDDHNYFLEAQAIAAAWSDGFYPRIWMKGELPYLGTLHIGYHRTLAAIFMAFGSSTLSGLFLNAFCLSWMPLLCALTAKYLFVDEKLPETDCGRNRTPKVPVTLKQVPLAAAILTAVHPAQFYWTSYLMKDAWTASAFWLGMTLVLGAVRRRSPLLVIAAVIFLPYLITVRIYAGVSIILGLLLLPGLRLTTRQFLTALIATFTLIVLFMGYTERGYTAYTQIRDSFAALAPRGADSAYDMLKQLTAGIPRLFLSPYAWIILPEPTPMYGMYPGMWFMYLIGYPLGFAGLYVAARRNIRLSIIPMATFGLAALLFLTAAYGGNASRQRYYLEYIFLVFAALALKYPSRPWTLSILLLEVSWAIGQLIALRY